MQVFAEHGNVTDVLDDKQASSNMADIDPESVPLPPSGDLI